MVLLKSVVQIAARSMSHLPAKLGSDRSGIGVMAVCRDSCRRDAGHRFGRPKECLGGRQIAVLAQHDIDQGTVAVDRTIQIPPLATYSDVRLIDVPAAPDPALAFAAQMLSQSRGELGFPQLQHRYMQVEAMAELVAPANVAGTKQIAAAA
jgi:hypothetical protein